MKLYEVNEEILRLTEQITVDEETGEISGDVDTVCSQLEALQMERRSILEFLARLVLNLRAEIAALKAEETRLHERRSRLEKKVERLLQILDRECAGEKTYLGVATLQYRKTTRVEVSDAAKAISWLKRRKLTDCFRIPAPEVAKAEVKKLLSAGTRVPGCALVEDRSYSLK
jgi:hypothetical protein